MKPFLTNVVRTLTATYRRHFSLDLRRLVEDHGVPRHGVLHIGANHGQEAETYQALGFGSVIWVEGLPTFFEILKKHIAAYPNQTALNYFASDIDREKVTIRIANTEGASTLLNPNKEFPNIHFVKEESYEARRTDSYFAEQGLTTDGFKFLVLDVEGYELKVLGGLGEMLGNFDYILTEISIVPNYHGGPDLSDMDDFLFARNYTRVKTWIGNYSGDALYKRTEKVSALHRLRARLSSLVYLVLYKLGIFRLKVAIRERMEASMRGR